MPMMNFLNLFEVVSLSRNRPTLTLVRQRPMRHKGCVIKLK